MPDTVHSPTCHPPTWLPLVTAAVDGGIPPDSPAADPIVADVVAAWLPGADVRPAVDGAAARSRLLAQVPALTWGAAGEWLDTALRANPEPGARDAGVAALLDGAPTPDPEAVLDGCTRVLAEVGALVAAVPADRLADPTPCAGWDVRALLNHLVYENLMWTSLAEGAPRSNFDADHVGGDHVAAFRAAAEAALAAFRRPGMLARQFGPAPGWRLVEQVVIEMLVHGWDLATATGQPTDLAPDIAEATLPAVRAIYGDLPRTPGGSFAPERTAPAGATSADRLAAYLGRTAR
jgi:uncharacterized protein (TIGR03086 family)